MKSGIHYHFEVEMKITDPKTKEAKIIAIERAMVVGKFNMSSIERDLEDEFRDYLEEEFEFSWVSLTRFRAPIYVDRYSYLA